MDPVQRALLERLIDHAALFPPASMTMKDALAEDRAARESEYAWMLDRFVCPASRLAELEDFQPPVSVIVDGQLPERADAIEIRLPKPRPDSSDLLRSAASLRALSDEVYFELVLGEDWRNSVPAAIGAIAAVGCRVKLRCGGEYVPSAEQVALVLLSCHQAGVVMKATAGLHHPLRHDGEHGFLNLLCAAALAHARGADTRELERVLDAEALAELPLDELDAERGALDPRAAVQRLRLVLLARAGGRPARVGVARLTLAFGVLRGGGVCARVGEQVLDLSDLDEVFDQPSLNAFMARGAQFWREAGGRVGEGREVAAPELAMPFEVADYVDFYSSLHHATNLGRMFRPGSEPLLPNWRHLPVGYHGRAGTVVASGTPVRRPSGQRPGPEFGPTRRLDIELEAGFVIGVPSTIGEPVPIERALDHVFGMVLVNDWSARDIQAWEYQPLGPFLGKSFATSISHWVVPLSELAERRVAVAAQEPEPLPYLREAPWAFDIDLEVELNGEPIAHSSTRHLYWSIAQQIAHLTVNGASLRTGDLLATGTISGPEPGERGSLIELSWNGEQPIELSDGSSRTFLEDGDEVVLRGDPLGEVRGRIEPARA